MAGRGGRRSRVLRFANARVSVRDVRAGEVGVTIINGAPI
jgi:hypothetical protein